LKHPTIFNSSDVAIITKMDLAEAAAFDLAAARRNIESVRPGMQIFEVSANSGSGMREILQFLRDQLVRSRDDHPLMKAGITAN
jgi:hydrogenase nickel incorporation protein HypB